MGNRTSNKMIELLIGNLEQNILTIRHHNLLTVFPLHLPTLPLRGHGAHGLGHGDAAPVQEGDLSMEMLNSLEEDGVVSGGAIISGNFDFNFAKLQSAVLPGDIMAVFIASPDLLALFVDDPLCVALLFCHVDTNRHVLFLSDNFDLPRDAIFWNKLFNNDTVISNWLFLRIFLHKNFLTFFQIY